MKNLKNFSMVLLAVLISFASIAATVPNSLEREKTSLRDEITFHVRDMHIDESEIIADITFIVNERNRIQIIDIDCADDDICKKVKSRLNNRKVSTKLSHKTETYHVKFIFRLE